jgi:hypothetical protein
LLQRLRKKTQKKWKKITVGLIASDQIAWIMNEELRSKLYF